MEIQEQIVNFADEAESVNFLKKEVVKSVGGMTFMVDKVTKRILTSERTQKQYPSYTIYCHDDYTEYVIGNLMRGDMKWGKDVNPKKIHVTTEKSGEYENWHIKSV